MTQRILDDKHAYLNTVRHFGPFEIPLLAPLSDLPLAYFPGVAALKQDAGGKRRRPQHSVMPQNEGQLPVFNRRRIPHPDPILAQQDLPVETRLAMFYHPRPAGVVDFDSSVINKRMRPRAQQAEGMGTMTQNDARSSYYVAALSVCAKITELTGVYRLDPEKDLSQEMMRQAEEILATRNYAFFGLIEYLVWMANLFVPKTPSGTWDAYYTACMQAGDYRFWCWDAFCRIKDGPGVGLLVLGSPSVMTQLVRAGGAKLVTLHQHFTAVWPRVDTVKYMPGLLALSFFAGDPSMYFGQAHALIDREVAEMFSVRVKVQNWLAYKNALALFLSVAEPMVTEWATTIRSDTSSGEAGQFTRLAFMGAGLASNPMAYVPIALLGWYLVRNENAGVATWSVDIARFPPSIGYPDRGQVSLLWFPNVPSNGIQVEQVNMAELQGYLHNLRGYDLPVDHSGEQKEFKDDEHKGGPQTPNGSPSGSRRGSTDSENDISVGRRGSTDSDITPVSAIPPYVHVPGAPLDIPPLGVGVDMQGPLVEAQPPWPSYSAAEMEIDQVALPEVKEAPVQPLEEVKEMLENKQEVVAENRSIRYTLTRATVETVLTTGFGLPEFEVKIDNYMDALSTYQESYPLGFLPLYQYARFDPYIARMPGLDEREWLMLFRESLPPLDRSTQEWENGFSYYACVCTRKTSEYWGAIRVDEALRTKWMLYYTRYAMRMWDSNSDYTLPQFAMVAIQVALALSSAEIEAQVESLVMPRFTIE